MKRKFSMALSLAVVLMMIMITGVFADTVASDVDLVTTGNQTLINLGEVAPGAVVNTSTSFQLVCAGKNHADQGDILTISKNSATIPTGGALSAGNATIGPVPSSWTPDTSGGGSTNCPSPAPIMNDNTNSAVQITAPTNAGTYDFVVEYKVDNTGGIGSTDVGSAIPLVTFRLTVVSNTPPTDTTLPTLHLPPDITAEATSQSGAVVTFTATADDVAPPHPTVSCIPASGDSFPLGPTTVNCTATDAAGNPATGSFTVTVVDTTAPTLHLPDDITAEATSALGAVVTFDVTANDVVDPNPTVICVPASGDPFPLGPTTVNCTATDAAGNPATGSFTVTVQDTTPPKQDSCDAPDGKWYASNVTLYCHYTDLVDGPSQVALSTSVTPGDETDNAIASANDAQACDDAGNCALSPADITGNKIDMKAPTSISFVGGGIVEGSSFYYGFVPAGPTGCTALDGGSSLASCNITGGGLTVGPHSFVATATDKVGNSGTATLHYTVLAWTFKGFYQPVDMNGVWNVIKGGQTVPLKFNIFAGPTELTAVSAIDRFEARVVSCSTASSATDDIEFTTTGGTTLRYDGVAGQFIQNWQTPKKPGVCYKVTMFTVDGNSLEALFKLK